MDNNLFDRIKGLDITITSQSLCSQIDRKGSTSHRVIGTYRQYLFLYGYAADQAGLPENITYIEFKRKYPKDFEIHIGVLEDLLGKGFRI